jgi:hypothetical protein
VAHTLTRMARGERGLSYAPPVKRRRDMSAAGATRLGISVETYRANVAAGLKWCSGHKCWHVLADTPWVRNRSTASGLAGQCCEWFRTYQGARRSEP